MRPLHELLRENIDAVLVLGGLFSGVGLPVLLIEQPSRQTFQPAAMMAAIALFVVAGLAMTIVGTLGFTGRYASLDERRVAVLHVGCIVTALLVAGFVGWAAIVATFAAMERVTFDDGYATSTLQMIRMAGGALGAMAGLHFATRRPPPDAAKTFWFSAFGGLAGWCLAYLALKLVLLAGAAILAMRYLMPGLRDTWEKFLHRPPATTVVGGDPRIADLRRQISWTENCGAPQAFRDEEVARLRRQIRDLGGTP